MSTPQPHHTLEDRLRAVEDTLAIYHLVASHPPAADTATASYYRDAFTPDGVIDLGGDKSANGNAAIAAIVRTPEHLAAVAGGLCHFAGLPRVELDGDSAIATSYLQIITPHQGGFYDEYVNEALPVIAHNLRKFLCGEHAGMIHLVKR